MSNVIRSVEVWLEKVVIGLNLCPFAKRELRNGKIRFSEASASTEEALLRELVVELSLLQRRSEIETTLLIIPGALTDFEKFNQFVGFAESVIEAMNLEGIYQLASFHPDYQFAETQADDVSNYTNRSPYPVIHILREASLERAIEQHPNTEMIPEQNITLMNELGLKQMQVLLESCMHDGA